MNKPTPQLIIDQRKRQEDRVLRLAKIQEAAFLLQLLKMRSKIFMGSDSAFNKETEVVGNGE